MNQGNRTDTVDKRTITAALTQNCKNWKVKHHL
jgi:hypothetical protein